MLHNQGIDWLETKIADSISHGVVKVNNKDIKLPIHKLNRKENIIQIFLYADENISGTITKQQLVFKSGHIFMVKNVNEAKDNKRGLLILFELKILEVEN